MSLNVTIGTPIYAPNTAPGLNDVTSGGSWTTIAPGNHLFDIRISATGTPDRFTWAKDGGAASAPVAITGAAQTLSDGVTVTFAATTGHTLADGWGIPISASGSIGGNYLGAGFGARFRAPQDKLREVIWVKDYGALGDGIADDTAPIQAAVNAAANSYKPTAIFFPAGVYRITGTISWAGNGCKLYGGAEWARNSDTTPRRRTRICCLSPAPRAITPGIRW